MKKLTKSVMALYGNVKIEKGYCENCKSNAFIRKGKYVCCGASTFDKPVKYHRVSQPAQHRRIPTKVEQERILQNQEYSCFYCGVPFWSTASRNHRTFEVRIIWDHKIPYSYSQDNTTTNFVAACHVCNSLKSDKIFQTVDEVQVYLANQRKKNGYDF